MNILTNTQIAYLNDRGASLLIEGKHEEAIHTFRQCSASIKSVLAMYVAHGGWNPSRNDHSPHRRKLPSTTTTTTTTTMTTTPRTHKTHQQQVFSSHTITDLWHPEFYIYNRPFLLADVIPVLEESLSAAGSTMDCEAMMRICSASSIFNIALSFHHKAMNGSWNAVASADKLYMSVLELLMDNDDDDEQQSCSGSTSSSGGNNNLIITADEVFLLAIAAANNLLHIRLMSQGASQTALSSLRLLQNCILPTLTRGERLQCISQTEWDSFCMNMYILTRSKAMISAPAA